MNPWQMAQQLKEELATVTWPKGSGEVVFGSRSVAVYAGAPPSEEELPAGFPFALVTIDGNSPDEDDPDLLEQQFTIIAAVEVAGDPLGEHAVIGGARLDDDYGKSAGAGLAEVAERVRAAVQKLTNYDGASIIVSGSGSDAANVLGRGRHLAFDSFNVTALCTSQPHYTAPEQLKLVGDTFSWEGSPYCTDRFDFVQFQLGYVAGSVPVDRPGDLDGVIYFGSAIEFASPAVAGRVYQIFADYNGHGAATSDGTSEAVRGSYLVT